MVKSKKAGERALRRKRDGEDDSNSLDDGGGGASESGEDATANAPDLSMDSLRKVFHLPCVDAAAALGVAHSKLKRRCHKLRIARWPQRKLASLVFLRDALPNDPRLSDAQRQYIINKIDDEYGRVMQDPNHPLDKELEQLRKSNYKLNYNRKLKVAAKTGRRGGTGADSDAGGGGGGARRGGSASAIGPGGSFQWGGMAPPAAVMGFGAMGLGGPAGLASQGAPFASPAGSVQDLGSAGATDSPHGWDAAAPEDEMVGEGMAATAGGSAGFPIVAGAATAGVGSPRKPVVRRMPGHLGPGVSPGGSAAGGAGGHSAPGRRSSLERAALLSVIAEGKISKQISSRRQSGSGSGSATPRQLGPNSGGLAPLPGLQLLGPGAAAGPPSPRGLPGSAGPQSPRVRRGISSPVVQGSLGGSREGLLDARGQLGAASMGALGVEDDWSGRGLVRPASPSLHPQFPGGLHPQGPGPRVGGPAGYPGPGSAEGLGYGREGLEPYAPSHGQYAGGSDESMLAAAGVNAILADASTANLLAGLEAAGGGRQSLGAEHLSEQELALLGIQGPDRDLILDPSTDASLDLDPLLDMLLMGDQLNNGSGLGRPAAQPGPLPLQGMPQSVGMYQQQHQQQQHQLLEQHPQSRYPGQLSAPHKRLSDAMPGGGLMDGPSVGPVGVASSMRSGAQVSGLGPSGGSLSAPYRQHRLSSVTGTGQPLKSRFAGGMDGAPGPSQSLVDGGCSPGDGGPETGGLTSMRSYDNVYAGAGRGSGGSLGLGPSRAVLNGQDKLAGMYGSQRHGSSSGLAGVGSEPLGFGGLDGIGGNGGGADAGRRWPSGMPPSHLLHQHMFTSVEGRHSAPGHISIPGWDDVPGAGGDRGLGGLDGRWLGYEPPLGAGGAPGEPRRMQQSSSGLLDPAQELPLLGQGPGPAGGANALDSGWRDRALELQRGLQGLQSSASGDAGMGGSACLDSLSGGGGGELRTGGGGMLSYGNQYGDNLARLTGRRLDRNLGGSWGPGWRRPVGMMLAEHNAPIRSSSTSGLMANTPGGPALTLDVRYSGDGRLAHAAGPDDGDRGYGQPGTTGLGSLSSMPQSYRQDQLAREQLLRAMHRTSNNGGSSGGGAAAAVAALQGHTYLSRPGVDIGGNGGGQFMGGRLSGLGVSGGPDDGRGSQPSPTPDTIASLQGLHLRGDDDRTASGELMNLNYASRTQPAPAVASSLDNELASVMQDLLDFRRQQQLARAEAAAGPGGGSDQGSGPGSGALGPIGGAGYGADPYGSGQSAPHGPYRPQQHGLGGSSGGAGVGHARYDDGGGGAGSYGGGGSGAVDGARPRAADGMTGGGGGGGGQGAPGGGLLEAVDTQLTDIDSFVERNLDLLRRNSGGFGSFVAEMGGGGAAGGGGGSFTGGGAVGMDVEFMRENLRRELRQGSAEQWEEMLRQLGNTM